MTVCLRHSNLLSLTLCVLGITACDTRGADPLPAQPRSFYVVSSTPGTARIWTRAGLAPGTTVTASNGGVGAGTTASDGSVQFDITVSGDTVDLSYTTSAPGSEDGALTGTFNVIDQQDNVIKPLYPVGSAPNDFVAFGAATIVANSLDNTVVVYGFDGAVLDTESLPQFSSPSYISTGVSTQQDVYVVSNGDNKVRRYSVDFESDNDLNLEASGQEYVLSNTAGAAFVGPGDPAVSSTHLYVPRSEIQTFGPTTYGTGKLSVFNLETGAEQLIELSGANAVTAETWNSPQGPRLLVLTAGELQFDQDFNPHLESDSYLDIFRITGSGVEHLDAINLGLIGASRLATFDRENDHFAYIGNLLSGNVYKVDLTTEELLRGQSDPIELTEEFTFISDLEMIPGSQHLACLSFNTDELFILDTATDTLHPDAHAGPYNLSLDPQLLAGCNTLQIETNVLPPRAYVLYGVANAMARVSLLEPFEIESDPEVF